METLSHNDLLALNRAIGEIYAARDMESFYRSVFSAIQGIIPGELCSSSDVNLHPARFLKLITSSREHSNVGNKLLPAFNAYLHEHPLTPHILTDTAIKTTDYASRIHFKGLAIYNEYYKHLDVETQINVTIPLSQEKISIFTLSRKSPDYSERDRLLLTLLKPHMMNALRNAMELDDVRLERDLLQKGAEAERQGAILFQADARMLCISPFAKEMLKKYFDTMFVVGETLPGILLEWFKIETSPLSPLFEKKNSAKSSKGIERKLLTVEKDGKCLKIKLLSDFTTGEYVIVVTEMDPSLAMQNLQGYGLSCREAEVLIWLTKGKTNVEIAIILSISKRTAEKHLENIFVKLGVETRAAAAAIMRS